MRCSFEKGEIRVFEGVSSGRGGGGFTVNDWKNLKGIKKNYIESIYISLCR